MPYSIFIRAKRNSALTQEIKQLQISEAELLRQQAEGNQKDQATSQIVPVTQQILESYSILTPLEKTALEAGYEKGNCLPFSGR